MWFRLFIAIQFAGFAALYFSESLSGFFGLSIGGLFFAIVFVLPAMLFLVYQFCFRRFDLASDQSKIKSLVLSRYGSKIPGIVFKAMTQEGVYRVYKEILKPTSATPIISSKPFMKFTKEGANLSFLERKAPEVILSKGFVPLGGDYLEKQAEASEALERSKFTRRLIAKKDKQRGLEEVGDRTRIASSIHSFPTRDNVTNAYSDK